MNYYDEIAKGYNELHGEEQKKKLAIIKQKLTIKPTDKLLDVGCGTGLSSDFPCEVIGIDPSKELLKQASMKTVCASAESIPFPDNSFDTVISVTCLQNFTDIPKALREIKRVGKNQFALTFLKNSPQKEIILKEIKSVFTIKEIIEEEKDVILLLECDHEA